MQGDQIMPQALNCAYKEHVQNWLDDTNADYDKCELTRNNGEVEVINVAVSVFADDTCQ